MWPFKKKKKVISRERFLQSRPLVNPALRWDEAEDGVITLSIPRSKRGLLDIFSKQMSLPEYKQVKLDEIGSKVWKKIDGKMSVREFIEWMYQEFKMNPREAEVSLGVYLERLSERGFILLLVPPAKPGTQEAKDEGVELRKRLKDLERDSKNQKISQQQYDSIKQEIKRRLELMGEKSE